MIISHEMRMTIVVCRHEYSHQKVVIFLSYTSALFQVVITVHLIFGEQKKLEDD